MFTTSIFGFGGLELSTGADKEYMTPVYIRDHKAYPAWLILIFFGKSLTSSIAILILVEPYLIA